MSEIIATIWIDKRLDEYRDYLTTERGQEIGYRTEAPKLCPIVDRLLQHWRATTYLAGMPAMYVISQERVLKGFVEDEVSDTSLVALTEYLLTCLAGLVPQLVNEPGLAKKLTQALIIAGSEFRDARAKAKSSFEANKAWNVYLASPVFQQYMWSSQRLSYQAIYNAYEDFLIECVNVIASETVIRTTDVEFKSTLKHLDVYDACWNSPAVEKVRLHRHSLAHVGGRMTENMKKRGIKPMNHADVTQVFPENIKAAIDVLGTAVLRVIDAAGPLPQYN